MAKKKKPTQAPLLSPENYIRQKARNLPITECWINSDWEVERFAHIVVARSHTNGNITVGLYMIDLACVGVKDAHYKFNLSPQEFRSLIEKISPMNVIEVDYVLVHNIIFAAEAYAADLGIKPHKDFQLAKYLLEEDTDEIELIDIPCGGENRKPLLVISDFYTKAETQRIIAQLEKSVGKGNFDVIIPDDEFEDIEENW